MKCEGDGGISEGFFLLAAVQVEPLDELGQELRVVRVADFSPGVDEDETLEQVEMGFGEFDFLGFLQGLLEVLNLDLAILLVVVFGEDLLEVDFKVVDP